MNFRKNLKDSSLLIFLLKIDKNQYQDTTKHFIFFDYSFHSGHLCHNHYDFLSEKIGTENFSTMLEQFEFEQPHHIRYEAMSFYQNICPGFSIMIVILKCCTCNNQAARYRYI